MFDAKDGSAGAPSRRSLMRSAIPAALAVGALATGLASAEEGDGREPAESAAEAAARKKKRPRPGSANAAEAFQGIPGRNINEVVLNYALTLEILEADLYRQALNKASGRALDAPLEKKASAYDQAVGNGSLDAGDAAEGFLYLVQFAYVEAAHRDFLRGAIQGGGGKPVKPNPGGYTFGGPVGNTLSDILGAILPLEETGVRAYLGALPYLTDLDLAVVAGGIFSTEARHSAAIAYVLGRDPGPVKMGGDKMVAPEYPSENTFEYYLQPKEVVKRVQSLFA